MSEDDTPACVDVGESAPYKEEFEHQELWKHISDAFYNATSHEGDWYIGTVTIKGITAKVGIPKANLERFLLKRGLLKTKVYSARLRTKEGVPLGQQSYWVFHEALHEYIEALESAGVLECPF